MAKLVDVPGLGPGGLAHGGSNPPIRTSDFMLNFQRSKLINKT